jgi:hypothetical protein
VLACSLLTTSGPLTTGLSQVYRAVQGWARYTLRIEITELDLIRHKGVAVSVRSCLVYCSSPLCAHTIVFIHSFVVVNTQRSVLYCYLMDLAPAALARAFRLYEQRALIRLAG